ncbi:hypothetical protein RFI_32951, partial [Reticulomyxa filosa]
MKEKLKQYYQSQDKLAPLFDDPEQSIDTCYIRLALKQKESKICHISIRGVEKVYCPKELHIYGEMYLLHIPLKKLSMLFITLMTSNDQKKDESNYDIEYLWPIIVNELHIPQWNSGLLYFWKVLHSSPPQIIPIHQMMLLMHCLGACNLIQSYLPNFQIFLHHPDIHLCIIDQIKIIQTQSNTFNDMGLMKDRLNLLQYLYISTETSDAIVQCYKKILKKH